MKYGARSVGDLCRTIDRSTASRRDEGGYYLYSHVQLDLYILGFKRDRCGVVDFYQLVLVDVVVRAGRDA